MNDYYNTIINSAFKACGLSKKEKEIIIQGYNATSKKEIYNISKDKKILPFIGTLMCSLSLDYLFWNEVVSQYRKRNQYMIEILAKIFSSFKRNGINKIFVYENIGALLASNSNIELFASGDIDLYADPAERECIERALAENGFYIKRSSYSRELVASEYYNNNLKEHFYISIMWQPLSRNKLPFDIDIDYCIDWGNLAKYRDTDITLPSPEALMYLCILHVSVHGYSRAPGIRLYIDIYNISKVDLNWGKVIDFAKHDNYLIRVVTVCIISKELLSINIPESIISYRNQHKKKIEKILKIVYDRARQSLNYNPPLYELIKIEAYSDNKSLIGGIFGMMFPSPKWIRKYYIAGGNNLLVGYLKHLKNLMM